MKSKSKKGIYIDLEKDLDDTMVKKTLIEEILRL